ncbi:MAG: hypothetical protein IT518_17395 [Burkholderiales bacterium]|nr:hypothetical protein [Burkholderiales bacterium]
MAYPEEPQRPLTATHGTGEPASVPPPNASSLGFARNTLAFYAVAIVACLALYAVLSVPGRWFPGAEDKTFAARDLVLTRGSGAQERDALLITAVDDSGLALVTANSDFRSMDYPIIAWSGAGFAGNADVRFLWRSDYAPGKLNSIPVPVAAGRLTPVVMAKQPDWVGRITGVALAVRGPLPEPVRVDGMDAKPGGVSGQIADRFREWLAFERWSGTSINTITGGADVQELPLPVLLVVAIVLAAGAWLAIAYRAKRTAAWPAVLALLFVATWMLLDAVWTWNLARQVAQTRAQYGGKDFRERHLAAEDGPLFAFIEKVRAKLPATPARVFVVADATYFRGRAAYHLYPHNAMADPRVNSLPKASSLRAGDYVVVYHRRGVQYNAQEQKLRFEGDTPVSAEAVLVEPGAALFRIL